MLYNRKKKIVIDIDRIKNQNTGMYTFCLNLMQNFLLHNDFNYIFYKHKSTILNKTIRSLNIKFWHSIFFHIKDTDLWHTTNQLAKRIPYGKFKFVYTIHDLNFLYSNKSDFKKNRLIKKIQKNCDRADAITFISKFSYEEAVKNLKINRSKCHIIYNGVTLKEFPESKRPKNAPLEDYIFTLGVIDPKKNIHTILNLLTNNNLNLVVSGITNDENYKKSILTKIKSLSLENRVFFTDAITEEDKYWYLKNCTAFIFPSISEGFGLPPIEAMRLGKPVFLSKFTSLPEIGGEHAYYFDDFSEISMQKTFKEGMEDYNRNNKKSSIIEWSNRYSWEKATKEYNNLYKKLLE